MIRRGLTLGALIAVALAGCAETGGTVPVSRSAGPGPGFAAPETAGRIFAEACIRTAPSFGGAGAALQGRPFTRSAATGTYFHDRLNLSVRATETGCSMVFAAEPPTDGVPAALARGAAAAGADLPPGTTVGSRREVDGLIYFRVGLEGG